jgi:hypothetical protein
MNFSSAKLTNTAMERYPTEGQFREHFEFHRKRRSFVRDRDTNVRTRFDAV